MKKGFTLIELLAVIVILAIILVIAAPKILKTIGDTKDASYKAQKNLIISSAEKYCTQNNDITFINNQAVITLKELQDNGYIVKNIKDSRTGIIIPDTSWVLVTNNSGEYSYSYGYETQGLVLHYDGIYNGGLRIHNDNTSANKAIWKDLSGNGKDGTLTNLNYDSTSGWVNKGILFDGLNDFARIPALASLTNLTFQILITRNSVGTISWSYGANTIIIYSTGDTYVASNSGSVGNGQTFSIINGNSYLLSVVYNVLEQKSYYYQNNVLVKQFPLPLNSSSFAVPSGQCIFSNYTCNESFTGGYVYSIRIYNRALTEQEIQNNYEVDKIRFGL